MKRMCVVVSVVAIAWTAVIGAQALERKILQRQDLGVPGYEAVLVEATLPPGAREGKHTHPGAMVGYLLQGTLELYIDGEPTVVYKQGESVIVPAGKVHEGVNRGAVPTKALVTLIVEKGKPLSTDQP